MAVTREDLLRIAALARIGVPKARVDALVRELGGILAHMEELAKVQAPADAKDERSMPLGPDDPGPVPLARPRESIAPLTREGFFLVPRLATHDDEAQGAS